MSGSFYSSETPDSCEADLLQQLLPAVIGRHFATLIDLNEYLSSLSATALRA